MVAGFTDSPIESKNNDCFKIGKYINGLSSFISDCNTPMTIAIQGDWGSGKTSTLNMVKETLGDTINAVWFNTWQFSKFNMDSQLTLSLLSCLTEELNKISEEVGIDTKDNVNKMLKAITVIGRLGSYAVDIMGAQKLADAMVDKIDSFEEKAESYDNIHMIQNLKSTFQNTIDKIYNITNKRIVIFIDDLDRLEPIKAVELLEVLKIFLDCKNCVYVLAIDYGVVTKGIAQKYGENFKHGKNFFDKIIQVPFIMPVSHYDIKNYVTTSMASINVKIDESNAETYINLIQNSVSSNPRAMKRLFNAFWLITKIHQDKSLDEEIERQILFALLCFQLSFEKIYNYIVTNCEEFCKEFFCVKTTEEASVYITNICETLDIKDEEYSAEDVDDFAKEFFDLMKGERETVKESEINKFKMILNISATTNNIQSSKQARSPELLDDYKKEKTINNTDIKYKICTLGSDFNIGCGKKIDIEYNGKSYSGKMHNSSKGRIDGMTTLYKENNISLGDVLVFEYILEKNKIIISKP